MKEPWVVYVPYCCCCPPKHPDTSRVIPVDEAVNLAGVGQPAWKTRRHHDSDAARALRDPTWLSILLRDCNGEVKVVWAKADIGADCNVISTTLLDKLRKDPSNATTTDPSLEDHRRDQSTFVVQGGLGLSLPTKPITEDGVRTFANKQAAFTETVELEFEAGHRRFNVVFCVLNTKEAESEADPKVNDKANANDMPHLLLGRPWLLGNHVLSFDISFLQTPVDFPHVLEPPTDDAVAEKLSRLHHSSSKYSPRGQNSARDRHTPQDFHKIGMQWPEWAEIDPWNLAYPLSLMIAGVYALIVLLS